MLDRLVKGRRHYAWLIVRPAIDALLTGERERTRLLTPEPAFT
jgi:hypothetical protein